MSNNVIDNRMNDFVHWTNDLHEYIGKLRGISDVIRQKRQRLSTLQQKELADNLYELADDMSFDMALIRDLILPRSAETPVVQAAPEVKEE